MLDYGDFVLTGEMTSLEMKDAKPCQRERLTGTPRRCRSRPAPVVRPAPDCRARARGRRRDSSPRPPDRPWRCAPATARDRGRRCASLSLIWRQMSPSDLPSQAIDSGASAPARMAGDALVRCRLVQREIRVGVACRAGRAEGGRCRAPDRREMLVVIGALQRMVAGGMAVHAARMGQHLAELGEDRARALRLVADALECRGRLKLLLRAFASAPQGGTETPWPRCRKRQKLRDRMSRSLR